ncbi:hypothetical protein [Thalassotalea mangrovi]|uniref:Uncharacterized protein n=1 Tax=Thalassotalea mangrovi TaxID=2572245 RepID=A0A4U1B4V5_9GAMM|nr:hypothetical protein [Thalassotalea mangrovi]TKB45384.1 hypothetical protein E8M12_09315 [Thalassotalea mangrovi]
MLVNDIIDIFESKFLELPKDFVIHGPYGIPKGGAVGIKSFEKKLNSKGHDKYYALSGNTNNRFGFDISLECHLEGIEYAELVIWYKSEEFDVHLKEVAETLDKSIRFTCGYEVEFNDDINPTTETKLRKGLFGSLSVEINFQNLSWLKNYENGEYRKIGTSALLSVNQFNKALNDIPGLKYEPFGNLYLVQN